MKRLLLDQGCPRSTAALLNTEGFDAVHVSELGLQRASDVQILRRAELEDRVCVTLDADFHAYLATTASSRPSVIRIRREGLDARALADLLELVWPRIEAALDQGAAISITSSSVRIRRLPIA